MPSKISVKATASSGRGLHEDYALMQEATVTLVSSFSSETFKMAVASFVGIALMPVASLVAGCLARPAIVASNSFLVGNASHFLSCREENTSYEQTECNQGADGA